MSTDLLRTYIADRHATQNMEARVRAIAKIRAAAASLGVEPPLLPGHLVHAAAPENA